MNSTISLAEGRMVLADTLLLATAAKPALAIDYATLSLKLILSSLGSRRAWARRD